MAGIAIAPSNIVVVGIVAWQGHDDDAIAMAAAFVLAGGGANLGGLGSGAILALQRRKHGVYHSPRAAG